MDAPEVHRLTDPADARLVGDWRALAARLGGSYFQTPDWALSWWAAGERPPTDVAVWQAQDGSPAALAALSAQRERLHPSTPASVRLWTNSGSGAGAADACGWLADDEAAPAAGAWAAAHVRRRPLLLRSVDAAARPLLPAGARLVGRSRCPRLDIPADPADLPVSAGFAKRLRYYRGRLAREGVTFAWHGPGALPADTLGTLVDLHRAERAARGLPSSFGRAFAPLHRGLVERGGRDRGPAAVAATHAGRAIGLLYGFVWQDTFAYYQSGWAPEWGRLSLATVLVAEAIRFAGERGLAVFDFLRGAEPYKYRFGAVDRVDESWLLPRGLGGRLLRAKYALKSSGGGQGEPGGVSVSACTAG